MIEAACSWRQVLWFTALITMNHVYIGMVEGDSSKRPFDSIRGLRMKKK